jgi:hypothetical protein
MIFGSMFNQKLQEFEEDIKPIGDAITNATSLNDYTKMIMLLDPF